MAVIGHDGQILTLHFAEHVLTAAYLKHLQLKHICSYLYFVFHKINSKQQQQPVHQLFVIFLSVKINPFEVLTNSCISVVST